MSHTNNLEAEADRYEFQVSQVINVSIRPIRLQLHFFYTHGLTNDLSDHEHQADGRGHIEFAPGPLLLGVWVTSRILLGMAIMVALDSQLNSGQVHRRDPASFTLPQRS